MCKGHRQHIGMEHNPITQFMCGIYQLQEHFRPAALRAWLVIRCMGVNPIFGKTGQVEQCLLWVE